MNIHSERATELVARWETELTTREWQQPEPGHLSITRVLVLTNDVRDRMRDDIVKLLELSIRDLTPVPPPS